jgi:hypothetical protein
VRERECTGGFEVACNNNAVGCNTVDSGPPRASRVRLDVVAGRAYFLVVDGVKGAAGDFVLNVRAPLSSSRVLDPDTTPPEDTEQPTAPEEPPVEDPAPARADAAYVCRTFEPSSDGLEPEETTGEQVSDRFADLVGAAAEPRVLCVPAAAEDVASVTITEPAFVRHDVEVEAFAPTELGTVRVRNALGDVSVDVYAERAALQAAVTVTPPFGPAVENAATPHACYQVRATSDVQRQNLMLSSLDEVAQFRISVPEHLCVRPPVAGDDSGSQIVSLCYAARRRAAPDDPGMRAQVEIASELGTFMGRIRSVEQVCLPSEIVVDGAPTHPAPQ